MVSRQVIVGLVLILWGVLIHTLEVGAPVSLPIRQPLRNEVRSDPAEFWRRSVQSQMAHLSSKTDVPYVWGGARIGASETCGACQRCITKDNVPIRYRAERCLPCRMCGADCSHFIGLVFKQAGLPYDFATTWELGHISPRQSLEWYNLKRIDQQGAWSDLLPGDVVLHPRHVTMIVRDRGEGLVDLLEMTRFGRPVGGIRVQRNVRLQGYRGGVHRVFRHRYLL